MTGMIEGFFGMKFSIPGFFGAGKFGKYFFGWLDFLATHNNITDLQWRSKILGTFLKKALNSARDP